MDLYLLRHGMAANRDPVRFPDDRLRPLTTRGEQRIRDISKAMRRLDLGIDLIWCSPFLRTRQTAAATAEELDLGNRLQPQEQLSPDGEPGKLLAELASLEAGPDNVLLVGHEPYLSTLLSILVSGGPSVQIDFKKGGLARLKTTGPLGLDQCAVLQWFLPPRLLLRI